MPLPINLVNGTPMVIGAVEPTAAAPTEVIPTLEIPTATEIVPTVEPTGIAPTLEVTEIVPTAEGGTTSVIQGLIVNQFALDSSGLSVQLTTNGSLIQLWDCNGSGAQQWTTQSTGHLRNPQSGRDLDVPGGTTTNGTRLQIWDTNTNAWQIWHLPA